MGNIWFADFETKEVNENEIRVCIGYIENLENNNSSYLLSVKDLFEFVKNNSKQTQTIYFHNLSYDGEFIIWWLIENGFKPVKVKVEHTNEFKEFTDFYGAKSEIYINYKGHKIRLLCSYKLWPVKLEKIGESLGLEKLNIDFNKLDFYNSIKDVPKDILDYVCRDVQILKMKYKQYSQIYPINKTASGSSWKVFKNWYEDKYTKQDFKYRYSLDEHWHKHLSNAYWGGFTQIKPEYIGQQLRCDIDIYDINSSYPAIFSEEFLPYGSPTLIKPEGEYVELIEAVIRNIRKVDLKMISHLHNWVKHNKFNEHYIDDYNDAMSVIYTKQEWEEIKKTYKFDIVTQQSIYFKASKQLKEYIDTMFYLKENEKDAVIKNDHKQILNTFTGKWGQSIYQTSRYLRPATDTDDRKYKYGDYVYQTYTERTKEIKYVPIAIFVTSLARVKLIQKIRENIDSFIYCDTDSMIILSNKFNYDNIDIDDNKLGFWKLQNKGTEIKIIKPKTYIVKLIDGTYNKVLAGINKECHHLFNFDNLFIGSKVINGNMKKKKLKGGFKLMYEDVVL